MDLEDLSDNWNRFGSADPLWAVATVPEYRGQRWNASEFFATGEQQVEEILRFASNRRIDIEFGHALDFGCGVGRLSQALASHFTSVTGIDIATTMLREAERYNRYVDKVTYLLNSRPDLSIIASSSIDFVYSEITLMHMEPQYSLAYVREFSRILRPRGVAVIQLPEPTRKQKLRSVIPERFVKVGNRLRTIRSPMMEIYGVGMSDLVDATWPEVEVIAIHPVRGDRSKDYRYWFRRSSKT